jgi:hypothetical protein
MQKFVALLPTKIPTKILKKKTICCQIPTKAISTLGIDEYQRIQAQKQKEYRAKRKVLKKANIADRKSRNFDVNDLINVREELRKER